LGSITVARQAREGVKALKTGDYTKALTAYRTAIGLRSDVPEFYYGIHFAGQKTEAWDQVTLALDAMGEQDLATKPHLAYEYGNCYTKSGRFDEAVPMLKVATAVKMQTMKTLAKSLPSLKSTVASSKYLLHHHAFFIYNL
jgi:tetratricopeptide (TPR) repeat protein